MTVWFVSRHDGALQWMRRHGPAFDRHVAHLDPVDVEPGDTVIGTLPVNLIAEICARGGSYRHLSLRVPAHARGTELDARQLETLDARLERFEARRIGND